MPAEFQWAQPFKPSFQPQYICRTDPCTRQIGYSKMKSYVCFRFKMGGFCSNNTDSAAECSIYQILEQSGITICSAKLHSENALDFTWPENIQQGISTPQMTFIANTTGIFCSTWSYSHDMMASDIRWHMVNTLSQIAVTRTQTLPSCCPGHYMELTRYGNWYSLPTDVRSTYIHISPTPSLPLEPRRVQNTRLSQLQVPQPLQAWKLQNRRIWVPADSPT